MLCGDRSVSMCAITERWYADLYPRDADVRFVDDVTDLMAVRHSAMDVLATRGIDAVISPTERTLQAAGYLRSYLGLPGIGYDQANLFSNKYAMKRFLEAAGIPVARFAAVDRLDELPTVASTLGYPIVVKPAIGAGGVDTFVLRTERELIAFLDDESRSGGLRRRRCRILAEKYVHMEAEFHCDGVVHDGAIVFAAISRYFMPLLDQREGFTGSYFLRPQHDDHIAATRMHAAVVRVLELDAGVTHLELFKTEEGFVVGEITCRPGGGGITPAVELQFGVDLWRAFIDTSLGRPPASAPNTPPSSARIVANTDLPIRSGRVVRITPSDEILRIPGVVRADMSVRAGDVIADRFHTSSSTGVVYFCVESEDQIPHVVDAIASVYELQTEAVEA